MHRPVNKSCYPVLYTITLSVALIALLRRTISPVQEPTKACSCAFHSLVIVIARIQLEHGVNALALIEGVNLLCVLSDTSQNRVSGFAFLVT